MEMLDTILYFVSIMLLISFGWLCNEGYDYYNYHREVNGLRFVYNNSHPAALKLAEKYDRYGHWVCVNIKGMDYNEIVTTCTHEAAHEVFAGIIEENPEKIEEVMNLVKNDTK